MFPHHWTTLFIWIFLLGGYYSVKWVVIEVKNIYAIKWIIIETSANGIIDVILKWLGL